MIRCADCNQPLHWTLRDGNVCEQCFAPLCEECGELCDACFIAECREMAEEEESLP